MLQPAWDAIPLPIRTIINVTLGGAVAIFVHDVSAAGSLPAIDWTLLGQHVGYAALVGLSTSIIRGINPLDTAYGAGKVPAAAFAPVDVNAAMADAAAVDALPAAVPVVADPVVAPVDPAVAGPAGGV